MNIVLQGNLTGLNTFEMRVPSKILQWNSRLSQIVCDFEVKLEN